MSLALAPDGAPPPRPSLDAESLRALFHNSLDALLLTAPDGTVLAANPAACALLGRTEEEICSLGRGGLVDVTDPRLTAGLEERRRTGSFRGELTMLHRDGTRIPVEVATSVFRDGTGAERTSMVIRDLTARQRALDEERARMRAALERERAGLALERRRLAAVLDLLPVAVWIADAQGRIVQSNPAATEVWGGRAPASPDWRRYHEEYRAWWPDGRPVQLGEWGLARAVRGEASGPEEVLIKGFDGVRRTILNYGVPIRDEAGAVVGAVAVSVDVTARKAAEEEARRARRQAEEASRAKSQFLATMSHEIRTPINAITGYVDLMETGIGGALGEEHQRFLARIRGSSRHLLRLVSDVLDLAKIEAGQMEVARESTALVPLLEEAVGMVLPLLEARGLSFLHEPGCGPGVRVWGDGDRIRQVLVNLLSNAGKFTPAGRVALRCRLCAEGPGGAGPWAAVEVHDSGIGIAPADLEGIFAPFTQLDAGYARKEQGTGLGLAISRTLARMMGGDVTVRSTPGEGSCFTLWLGVAGE